MSVGNRLLDISFFPPYDFMIANSYVYCNLGIGHPFALIPVGYPDGQKNEFVDRFDQKRIHYNRW